MLLLVVHAYVLLHFLQFADKLGVFNAQLVQIADEDVQRLRRQLPLAEATARVVAPKTDAKKDCEKDEENGCDWSAASFAKISRIVPIQKIRHLDKEKIPHLEGEDEMANRWGDFGSKVPALNTFEEGVTERLHETGCVAEGAQEARGT